MIVGSKRQLLLDTDFETTFLLNKRGRDMSVFLRNICLTRVND